MSADEYQYFGIFRANGEVHRSLPLIILQIEVDFLALEQEFDYFNQSDQGRAVKGGLLLLVLVVEVDTLQEEPFCGKEAAAVNSTVQKAVLFLVDQRQAATYAREEWGKLSTVRTKKRK